MKTEHLFLPSPQPPLTILTFINSWEGCGYFIFIFKNPSLLDWIIFI